MSINKNLFLFILCHCLFLHLSLIMRTQYRQIISKSINFYSLHFKPPKKFLSHKILYKNLTQNGEQRLSRRKENDIIEGYQNCYKNQSHSITFKFWVYTNEIVLFFTKNLCFFNQPNRMLNLLRQFARNRFDAAIWTKISLKILVFKWSSLYH